MTRAIVLGGSRGIGKSISNALKTIEQVETLKQKGAKLQLNALSLLGFYGPDIQKKGSLWLKKGLYDMVATDAHNPYQLQKLNELHLNKKELLAWKELCEKQMELICL